MHNSKPSLSSKELWLNIQSIMENGQEVVDAFESWWMCVIKYWFHKMCCLCIISYKSPRASKGGCKRMQKSCVHDHEKNNEHRTRVARWEVAHFPSYGMVFMSKHVQHALEKEHAKIITCMKVFFSLQLKIFPSWIMKVNVNFERLRTLFLSPSMMSRAYTSRSTSLEFLWALSKHLKSILNENAFTSHVYSILVNASTNQMMEQHLIVCCCYLGSQGRGC